MRGPQSVWSWSLLLLGAHALAVGAAPQGPNDNRSFISRPREQFKVLFEWKTINFTWPSPTAYRDAIATNKYVPKNVFISDVKHFNNRLYVTVPRIKDGVPATLASIPAAPVANDTKPLLTPFPSWEMNLVGDCRAFQSVHGIEIDAVGFMWVVDNGKPSTPSSFPSCPPSLTIVNLNDGKNEAVKYIIPDSVANSGSDFRDLVVDDTDGGYAYITDASLSNPGIVVFNRQESRFWKFSDETSMRHAMNATRFNVGDVTVDLPANLYGIALGPRYINKKNVVDRNLYFCPLASFSLYGTPTSVLRSDRFSLQADNLRAKLVVNLGAKSSQTAGMIMDEEGYMFYGLLGNHSIAHWDHRTNFNSNQETIAKDKNYIQWVDRFAFDNVRNIYVMINRMQNFLSDRVDVDQVNYRILRSYANTRSYLYSPMLMAVNNTETATKNPQHNRVIVTRNGVAAMSSNLLVTCLFAVLSSLTAITVR